MPIMSYPFHSDIGCSVKEMACDSSVQFSVMKYISENFNVGAVLNMMDLSVEAEAFGSEIRFSDNEIPEVIGNIISDVSEVSSLCIPSPCTGRTNIIANAVKSASEQLKDCTVLCGVIGPYSLAGRLFDMSELMIECFENPDDVNILLDKTTEYIISYARYLKESGADGILLCEPAAGLLSPEMAEEFSNCYVRKIFENLNSTDFICGYHNCGSSVNRMPAAVASLGADIYHFGNAVDIGSVISCFGEDCIVMGNIDPMIFKEGKPSDVRAAVRELFDACSSYSNFMISTGCDLPPDVPMANIEAYFSELNTLY